MKFYLSASILSLSMLIGLIFGYNASTKSETLKVSNTKCIVFDLGDVLFKTSSSDAFWEMGPLRLAGWICNDASTWSPGTELRKTYFDFLNKVTPRDPECPAARESSGLLLPQCMCDWMSGKIGSTDLLAKIEIIINEHPEYFASKREKKVIRSLCHMTFTPEKLVKTRAPIKKMWQLLRDCKKNGFNIYVLSNWDAESFEYMKKRFPHFDELVDGILISADAGTIKPDPAIFHQLFKKFNIAPQYSIFFDDRIENISAAKSVGMNTVWCYKGKKFKYIVEDFEEVTDQLATYINNQVVTI